MFLTLGLGKHRRNSLAAGLYGVDSACLWGRGQGDAASGEVFAGGIRRQEEADAARQVFGRDGAGRTVGAAGGTSAPALSEGRARPASDRSGADAADLL